jgi:allantoate deiminase
LAIGRSLWAAFLHPEEEQSEMNINSERLWKQILELGQIGKNTHGGVTRLSFTDEEKQAKEYVAKLMEDAGLKVYRDPIGNLFGRFEGSEPQLPVVLVGSHLDSVINGGIFDGPAGVLTAIEALKILKEQGITTIHPIEVVAFTDEEGARFNTGMFGSKALCGRLSVKELYEIKDQQQITLADAMKQFGYDPDQVGQARRDPASIKAYLELHIEQGKVLESAGLPVGVVSGIAGPLWLQVILKGEAGHAGTTPMNLRKDPLVAAAHIIQALEDITKKRPYTVGTVGKLQVEPGGTNIIPGTVKFTMDIRDTSIDTRNEVEREITQVIESVCQERGIGHVIEVLHRIKPVSCSPVIMELIEQSCREVNISTLPLISGAGHDAMVLADVTDVGMIFVKSKEGISHNPKEWTDQEDLAYGAEVLFHTIQKLAN